MHHCPYHLQQYCSRSGSMALNIDLYYICYFQRDGLKSCSHCNSSVGLRAKQCSNCKHPFPVKTKDWNAIERHSATMKDTYIKDKIFDRVSAFIIIDVIIALSCGVFVYDY